MIELLKKLDALNVALTVVLNNNKKVGIGFFYIPLKLDLGFHFENGDSSEIPVEDIQKIIPILEKIIENLENDYAL